MVNVGDIAPDFELLDTELKMRKLEEFAGKNVVIVPFLYITAGFYDCGMS